MKHVAMVLGLLMATLTVAAAQGKLSGYMFGDYFYNIARDDGFASLQNTASQSGPTAMQAFQLRRIYFTYDNDISEVFTTRFRLEADQGALSSDGKIVPFVKDAYLRWKNVIQGSDLIFGIQPTPAYEISEAAWGYRSLEKTVMDLRGIVSSRDQGVSLKGKLTTDGMVNYWLMIANNSSNKPETDKYKRYYAQVQLKPTANLQATAHVDYADRADIADAYHAGSTIGNSVLTASLFVGYAEPFVYNINVEGYLQSTANGVKDTSARNYSSKTGIGISVFASYFLLPELSLVTRADYCAPSLDDKPKDPVTVTAAEAARNTARMYLLAGLSWKVDRNVSIMPNLVYETYDTVRGGAAISPSVTGRVTLYYVFL